MSTKKCGFTADIFCLFLGVWKQPMIMTSFPVSPHPPGSKHISQWPPKTKRCRGEKLELSVLPITGFLIPHYFLLLFFCMQTTELTRSQLVGYEHSCSVLNIYLTFKCIIISPLTKVLPLLITVKFLFSAWQICSLYCQQWQIYYQNSGKLFS